MTIDQRMRRPGKVAQGGSWLAQGRFAILHLTIAATMLSLAVGGLWLWLGAAAFFVVSILADLGGDAYQARPDRPQRILLEGLLLTAPPMVLVMLAGMLLYAASPGTPAALLADRLGLPRADTGWLGLLGLVVATGQLSGAAAVSFGHDLIHRRSHASWLMGELILARCLNPALGIEHLSGHHAHVGTCKDPSTAPRGMGFWRYAPRDVVLTFRNAARHEAGRLRRHGHSAWSWRSRLLQGIAMAAGLLALAGVSAGVGGLASFVASALVAQSVIELTNYVSHYGLVRAEGTPIEPRHSWNAPHFFSTSAMANAQRHSHHHAAPGAPFWNLSVMEDGAFYPHNAGAMCILALFPPIWFRFTAPLLDDWDRHLASTAERTLTSRQVCRSAVAGDKDTARQAG